MKESPCSSTSWPLLSSVFWMLAILMGVENYLITVLFYSSLLTYDVEHLFSSVFAIRISPVTVQIICIFN